MAPSSDLSSVNTHLALTCQSGLPTAVTSTKGSESRNAQPADDAEKRPIEYKAGGWQILYYWNKVSLFSSHFKFMFPGFKIHMLLSVVKNAPPPLSVTVFTEK